MTREIVLASGEVCLVDHADFALVADKRWHASKPKTGVTEYARCSVWTAGRCKNFYMHRLILGVSRAVYVDHINGNGLDNRRANLRTASASQNLANRSSRGSASGFLGVYPRGVSFFGRVIIGGVHHCTPLVASPIHAAKARDALALKLFGEFARLNFPEDHPDRSTNRPASRHGEHVPGTGTSRHSNKEG